MVDSPADTSPALLVVDDEAWICHFLENVLVDRGYRTFAVSTTAEAYSFLREEEIDAVLVDLTIESLAGFDVIQKALTSRSKPEVIVMTGENRVEHAVRALELGAFDFLAKPLDSQRLHLTFQRALEHRRLKAEILRLSDEHGAPHHTNLSARTLAFYDSVTGLANRPLFFDRLDQALMVRSNSPRCVALVVFTVRELRQINLAYDIEDADSVLVTVAQRIQKRLYRRDTIARTGDNQFSIVAELESSENVTQLLGKIESAAGEVMTRSGRTFFVSFLGGAALFPDDAHDSATLYHHALSALDAVEHRGEVGFGVYHPDLDKAVQWRLATERRLAGALRSEEYFLEMQPYHRLADGGVQGAETLLRWNTGDGKTVAPAQFIPLLEANFGIIAVTEWIVEQIAAVQQRLIEQDLGDQYLSMNISPVHFSRPSASVRLADLILDTCPDPSHIIVELTEGALLKDNETCSKVLHRLGEGGVSIAIDDFGTGYSSLSYLTRHPVDYLKIDRSFVKDADTRGDAATIVAAIISMAQQLGIAVVAEGAETEAELGFLRSYGCDIVQGFAFSKPLEISRYYRYIEESTPTFGVLESV